MIQFLDKKNIKMSNLLRAFKEKFLNGDSPAYDEVVSLAASICGTEMAIMSIIDEENSLILMQNETFPLDTTLCSIVAKEKNLCIIHDLTKDPRALGKNTTLNGKKIIFYAGYPLQSSRGDIIGSLCVVDSKSILLTEIQKKSLIILANRIVDMIELELTRQKLLETNNDLKHIFNSVEYGVITTDLTGKILEANNTFLKKFKLSPDQAVGIELFRLLKQSEETTLLSFSALLNKIDEFKHLHWKVNEQEFQVTISYTLISQHNRPSKCLFHFYDNQEKTGLYAEIENQNLRLFNSAKMASLGEMAAGVAHEINNPLAIIQGKTDLLIKKLDETSVDPSIIKGLKTIAETTKRISNIVRGLQVFSRPQDKDPMEIYLYKDIIEDVLGLCSEKLKAHGVTLHISNQLNNVQLECRKIQISQVLLNILNNAFDAVSNCPEKWIRIESKITEDFILISISNSGPLIPADVAPKLMSPFFTTKGAGKGTGLGLSISKNIMEEHRGSLILEKELPCTTFTVQLPIKQSSKKMAAS